MPLQRPPSGQFIVVVIMLLTVTTVTLLGAGFTTREWYVARSPQRSFFVSLFRYCEDFLCQTYPYDKFGEFCEATVSTTGVLPQKQRSSSEIKRRVQLLQIMYCGSALLSIVAGLVSLANCTRSSSTTKVPSIVACILSAVAFVMLLAGVILVPLTFQATGSNIFCGLNLCDWTQLELFTPVIRSECSEALGFSYWVTVGALFTSFGAMIACLAHFWKFAGIGKEGEMKRSKTKLYSLDEHESFDFGRGEYRITKSGDRTAAMGMRSAATNHQSLQETTPAQAKKSTANTSDVTSSSQQRNVQQQEATPGLQNQGAADEGEEMRRPLPDTPQTALFGGGAASAGNHHEGQQPADSRSSHESHNDSNHGDVGLNENETDNHLFDPSTMPLPPADGDWAFDDQTGLYWSNEEYLFLNTVNNQYYDPKSDMWYDPESDRWYSDE